MTALPDKQKASSATARVAACVVITPARNEAEFLKLEVESMAAQTVRPQQWIIVDDGSTDSTASLALAAAKAHPWISFVQRPDRGFRQPGGGVVEAFYEGYRLIRDADWEFVVKFDGDLSFDRDFFEKCLLQFEKDPKLGIGGGAICKREGQGLVPELPGDPAFHVRGATKIYRRACWEAIGGLFRAPGWDTVDEFKANMLGWTTYTFPELKLWHHRPTGGAQGTWKNWVKNGLANYIAGYHPLFMMAKCARRLFHKPYGVVGIGLLVGFWSGYLRRVPQVDDREVIRYVRSQQIRKLFLQKSLWDRKPA
jgi:biofilm PGA synthesis N-glycosyltransferase PgaC